MSLRDSLGLTALACLGPRLGLLAACAQQPTPDPTPLPASHPLQGTWKGDDGSDKVTVTIEGSSLYFYRGPDFQYDASIALIPDTDPPEFHATILDTPRTTDSQGELVVAIYAFENDTLHLVAISDPEGERSFDDNVLSRYYLERVPAGE